MAERGGVTIKTRKEYFRWLVSLVYADEADHSFLKLCQAFHNIPFEWTIPKDENRAKDGLKLREEFYGEKRPGACSFLEFLIALSERMTFICGFDDAYWFYEMIENLGLDDMGDERFEMLGGEEKVRNTVDIMMNRKYGFSGYHGLFPLKMPKNNQKNVEIWYQMQAYLGENYDIN